MFVRRVFGRLVTGRNVVGRNVTGRNGVIDMLISRSTAYSSALRLLIPAIVLTAGVATVAMARFVPPIKDPVVAKECSACHMPFPAGLLPAPSWSALVAGLDNHFGENASVDAATAAKLSAYLTQNAEPATRGSATGAPVLRITELDWFKRKHGKNRLSPERLARKGAKSAAQCEACHQGAVQGEFKD